MPRLLVIGSSNTDMTVRLPALPRPGETVLGGSFFTGAGGKGANQAVAAARAGASVVFVSAVGNDSFGRKAVLDYQIDGLDVSFVRTLPDTPSGVALIFVGEEGENMIGVASGANAALGPGDIDALPDKLFFFYKEAWLLVAGLEIPLETVERALKRAAGAGMRVILNPAPAVERLVESGLLDYVDVITPNQGELATLTGRPTDARDEIIAAAQRLRAMGPKAVVVTLGANGCLVCDASRIDFIPAIAVRAVDTVGAGDAFTAALAVALNEGHRLDEAATWATAAAALAVMKPGAQSSFPRREEIYRLAATRGNG